MGHGQHGPQLCVSKQVMRLFPEGLEPKPSYAQFGLRLTAWMQQAAAELSGSSNSSSGTFKSAAHSCCGCCCCCRAQALTAAGFPAAVSKKKITAAMAA